MAAAGVEVARPRTQDDEVTRKAESVDSGQA